MALKFLHGKELNVRYGMLKEICGMVEKFSGMKLHRNKPVVGENAFSHESGIHVDGILKDPATYEYYDPKAVGHSRNIYAGKHSGSGIIKHMFGDYLDVKETLNSLKMSSEEKKTSFKVNKKMNISDRERLRLKA